MRLWQGSDEALVRLWKGLHALSFAVLLRQLSCSVKERVLH